MGLKKYKLGELIKLSDERNTEGRLGMESVRGISNAKEIMTTKADVDENVIRKFYIVRPNEFIYNPRTTRMGDKVGLAYNNTDIPLLFSFNNIAFSIKDTARELILPHYLYMFFNRSEFDRYAIVHSWGSATELFSFEEMCDIDISLPNISQQRKYVDVYMALQSNLAAYQSKVEDLKLVCDGYIEDLRKRLPCEAIGKFIKQKKRKNPDNKISNVWGVSSTRKFIEASSAVDKSNLSNYKVVDFGDIAYVPTTHLKVYAIAISDKMDPFVVSPIYEVFAVKDKDKLDPEYLYLWLCRDETMRYAFYNSWGSARENFNYEDMCSVKLPIPSIEIQRDIVSIHRCYVERQRIAVQLKEQLNNLCPILIKGSLQN